MSVFIAAKMFIFSETDDITKGISFVFRPQKNNTKKKKTKNNTGVWRGMFFSKTFHVMRSVFVQTSGGKYV